MQTIRSSSIGLQYSPMAARGLQKAPMGFQRDPKRFQNYYMALGFKEAYHELQREANQELQREAHQELQKIPKGNLPRLCVLCTLWVPSVLGVLCVIELSHVENWTASSHDNK